MAMIPYSAKVQEAIFLREGNPAGRSEFGSLASKMLPERPPCRLRHAQRRATSELTPTESFTVGEIVGNRFPPVGETTGG